MEEQLMLYVRYMAKDGCRETFVRELVEAGILTLIREEPGCLAYDYYFSAQDENELLLIERWESAAHQRVHMEQPCTSSIIFPHNIQINRTANPSARASRLSAYIMRLARTISCGAMGLSGSPIVGLS